MTAAPRLDPPGRAQAHLRPVPRPATALPRPFLVALVVTHNRLDQLRRTVERLLAEQVDHVVVVDNASNDGTGVWLAQDPDPRLNVIRAPRNLGGAGGFELGLSEIAARFDPEWCVVMDDDARPDPDVLARFRDEVEDYAGGSWDAVAAGVFYPDGKICEMNRPSRNPFWRLRAFLRTALGGGRNGFHLSDTEFGAATLQQVDASSFVGLFLSRRAMARAGLPDGRLFLYGDDVIYTLGLTRAGGRIGFAPWLRFEHDCSTFERDESSGMRLYRPLWKVYYNYRNGLMGYRLAAGRLLFWPVLAVVLPKWFSKSRAYGFDAPTYRKLLRLAVSDALKGRCDRPHDEIVAIASSRP